MSVSTVLPESLLAPAVPTEAIWRLTVAQYHDMIHHGILTDDDPVELLEGWLVPKMPKNPAHRLVTELLRELLDKMLPAGWHVNNQEPITLEDGEPEPDLSVVRGSRRDYRERHPGPTDLAPVIEVSDHTLARDRGTKKRSYARAGIGTYWIVNLVDRKAEVYTQPSGPAEKPVYAGAQEFGRTDSLPFVVEGQEVGRVLLAELWQ